jgi:hypothetical protein
MSRETTEIEIIEPREQQLRDAATDEEMTMVLGTEIDVLGRMSEGLDESEFDNLPSFEWDISPDEAAEAELYTSANPTDPNAAATVQVHGEDDEVAPFKAPTDEVFPTFKRALAHFGSQSTPTRVVRIDTDASYDKLVGDSALRELDRRMHELRSFVEGHVRDLDAHNSFTPAASPLSDWHEVIGCAETINAIRGADTSDDMTDAMAVPLDLPDFAQGKVKCWRDGDMIVVSLRFATVDGTPRYATMAGKPRVDTDDVLGWAQRAGVDPVTILGAAMDLADVACGKRLVRDAAQAALSAQRRIDVVGMSLVDDPVVLTNVEGDEEQAPLAALMYVQQRANAGDKQAQHEMSLIETAAKTKRGKEVAAPLLKQARERLKLAGKKGGQHLLGSGEGCWR